MESLIETAEENVNNYKTTLLNCTGDTKVNLSLLDYLVKGHHYYSSMLDVGALTFLMIDRDVRLFQVSDSVF